MQTKPTELYIAHGNTTHSFASRFDCLTCIDIEIDWLYELKKAGGQTRLLEKLEEDLRKI